MKAIRSRRLLAALALGLPFLSLAVLAAYHHGLGSRSGREIGATTSRWNNTPFVAAADRPRVTHAIQDLVHRGTRTATGVPPLTPEQEESLTGQVTAMFDTYSTGDFENYLRFRMPAGVGVHVTWDPDEITNYTRSLPPADLVRQAVRNGTSEQPEKLRDYSLGNEFEIWKFGWIVGNETRFEKSGGKVFCTDCWIGLAPELSEVRLVGLPVQAGAVAREQGHLGIAAPRPDLVLAPPSDGRDTTPKAYAVVRLHVRTNYKIGAYPVYAVFALATGPEAWIPTSLAAAYRMNAVDYLF